MRLRSTTSIGIAALAFVLCPPAPRAAAQLYQANAGATFTAIVPFQSDNPMISGISPGPLTATYTASDSVQGYIGGSATSNTSLENLNQNGNGGSFTNEGGGVFTGGTTGSWNDTLLVQSGSLPSGSPVAITFNSVYTGSSYADASNLVVGFSDSSPSASASISFSGMVADNFSDSMSLGSASSSSTATVSFETAGEVSDPQSMSPTSNSVVFNTFVGATITLTGMGTGSVGGGLGGQEDISANYMGTMAVSWTPPSNVQVISVSTLAPAPSAITLFGLGICGLPLRVIRRRT